MSSANNLNGRVIESLTCHPFSEPLPNLAALLSSNQHFRASNIVITSQSDLCTTNVSTNTGQMLSTVLFTNSVGAGRPNASEDSGVSESAVPSKYGPCDDCGKIFKSEASLSYHNSNYTACPQRKRSTEQEFKCHFCEKSFTRKRYMDQHVYGVHKRLYNINTRKTTNQSTWGPCDACGKTFKSKSSFSYHSEKACPQKKRHIESDFMCEYCKKSFAQKRYLRQHVFGVHKQSVAFCLSDSDSQCDAAGNVGIRDVTCKENRQRAACTSKNPGKENK